MLDIYSITAIIIILILSLTMIATKSSTERIKLEDIKITKRFRKTPPRKAKMQRKEDFFDKNWYFQDKIILDENNRLLDGYTSYLLAKSFGVKEVEIIRDKNN